MEKTLFGLCDLLFSSKHKYICVNSFKACFSSKKGKGFTCFDLPLFKKGDFKVTPYFIKNLMKVCYYLNQKDNGEHMFMYKELLKKSPLKRKRVVRILLQIRKNNWDKKSMKDNLPPLLNFINSISH